MPYALRRLLAAVPLMVGITCLSFAIMQWAPGDPTDMFADPQMSYEDVVQLRQNLGLDKPILVQYVYWLKGVCKGELGYSHIYGKPVMTALLERLPATLILSISSFT